MPGVQVQLPIIGDSLLAHHPSNIDIHDPCLHGNLQTLSTPPVFSHNSRPRRSHGSLSFLSSSAYRSEYLDLPVASSRRTMDRATVNISPFRSVRQMKEPFQLKLPTSPSFDPGPLYPISNRDSKDNKAQPRGLQSPIGLRPLRTCRSDQNLVAGALKSFGLLPSPSLSDSHILGKPKPQETHMEDKSIVSKCVCIKGGSCEACFTQPYNTDIAQIPPDLKMVDHPEEVTRDEEVVPSKTLSESASTPHMPSSTAILSPISPANSKKRTRTATVSSATSWAPGDLTYCESWLQGVPLETPDSNDEKARETNRRKFQIVQQIDEPLPPNPGVQGRKAAHLRIDTNAANNPIMLAVASKMRPKLVDISRPSSSGTTFSVPIHPPPSWRRPSTPERRSINEISAFSPDTPQDVPDSGYVTQQSNRSSEESHEFNDDDYVDALDFGASSDTTGNLSLAVDLFSEKLSVRNGYVSCYKRHYAPSYSRKDPPHTPPAVSPRTVEQESLAKWWDYEWTLDQLEESIKEFPKQTLRLTSPVIILIRQNHEKALLRPFRKIFSGVPDNLIDYLCAALIAKNYLVSMAATHHKPNHSMTPPLTQIPNNNLSKLDSVPEKARATLGITLPTSNKFQVADRLMGTRSLDLQKGLDRIVDKLLYTICGRHDDTLKASVAVLMQVLEAKA